MILYFSLSLCSVLLFSTSSSSSGDFLFLFSLSCHFSNYFCFLLFFPYQITSFSLSSLFLFLSFSSSPSDFLFLLSLFSHFSFCFPHFFPSHLTHLFPHIYILFTAITWLSSFVTLAVKKPPPHKRKGKKKKKKRELNEKKKKVTVIYTDRLAAVAQLTGQISYHPFLIYTHFIPVWNNIKQDRKFISIFFFL